MANWNRFQGGNANPTPRSCDPLYPFEKGDMLFYHSSSKCVRPMSDVPPCSTEALTQLACAEFFAGMAMESWGMPAGAKTFRLDDNQGPAQRMVAQGGLWEFDCPAGSVFAGGQPVGVFAEASKAAANQKVDALASPGTLEQAIGVAQPSVGALTAGNTGSNRVLVEIIVRKPAAYVPTAGTYSGTSGQGA